MITVSGLKWRVPTAQCSLLMINEGFSSHYTECVQTAPVVQKMFQSMTVLNITSGKARTKEPT